MSDELRLSIIGLDTSHAVEFAMRLQAPDCPMDQKVDGGRVVKCLRFATPFQDEAGLDQRQASMEAWGVKVTTDFREAVEDCDAIMICINDPSYHLEFFSKCAEIGKPIFLDKPLADTRENGIAICNLAKERQVRVMSSSSLRSAPGFTEACKAMPEPKTSSFYGPLGRAPVGSSIVWYGVHAFEMLQRSMGCGARRVSVHSDQVGITAIVEYDDCRHGIVELVENAYVYGGCLRSTQTSVSFSVDTNDLYVGQLSQIVPFLKGDDPPLSLDDTLEVMLMLDAAERSCRTGRAEEP